MCQYQLSSAMLPNDAPMPPWAATVWERVGNTLDSTATFRPASASCSDARMPAPPDPTMTASKRRDGRVFLIATNLHSPQNLQGPGSACEQPCDGGYLQGQAQSYRLNVIHPDIAHPDPGMIDQRQES